MAVTPGKKNSYERRLKELKKETELVRSDIRALSKLLKNPDEVSNLPKLKSVRMEQTAVPAPSRKDPVQAARSSLESALATEPGSGLFDVTHSPAPSAKTSSATGPLFAPRAPEPSLGPKNRFVAKNERFASYFSSGNFLGARPAKHGRSVQRNKAIFMIIVVIAVAFSVFKLVFK